jgi:hypothetical protein
MLRGAERSRGIQAGLLAALPRIGPQNSPLTWRFGIWRKFA